MVLFFACSCTARSVEWHSAGREDDESQDDADEDGDGNDGSDAEENEVTDGRLPNGTPSGNDISSAQAPETPAQGVAAVPGTTETEEGAPSPKGKDEANSAQLPKSALPGDEASPEKSPEEREAVVADEKHPQTEADAVAKNSAAPPLEVKPAAPSGLESDDEEEEEVAVGAELEGSRKMTVSLFEEVEGCRAGGDEAELAETGEVNTVPLPVAAPGVAGVPGSGDAATAGDAAAVGEKGSDLQRSYLRWSVVRLSYNCRLFLARAPQHFVRLAAIFRLFHTLEAALPCDVLVKLLEPLVSAQLRCSTAFGHIEEAPPDIRSMAQAMELGTKHRLAFLAQLAQQSLDALEQRLRAAGYEAVYARTLVRVRAAVAKQRGERKQREKMRPVVEPEAAARRKRTKNLRRTAAKKRAVSEVIRKHKGGPSAKRAKFRKD